MIDANAKSAKVKARGKINLSLNITGASGGMHILDSVTAPVDIFDVLNLRFSMDGKTEVSFSAKKDCGFEFSPVAIPENNTVIKAINLLREFCPQIGLCADIEKGIPLGGGLGGSSADAAAVLFAAVKLYSEIFERDAVFRESARIGGDVPVMLAGGFARMRGSGEKVLGLTPCVLHTVIASEGNGVLSGKAYAEFDRLYPSRELCPSNNDALALSLARGDLFGVAAQTGNALTEAAKSFCPQIGGVIKKLSAAGALSSWMTGSGNCCCGLFENENLARKAAHSLALRGAWAVYAPCEKEGNVFMNRPNTSF